MNSISKTVLVVVLAIALITPAALFYGMKISPVSWQLVDAVNHESGLVLKGYDAVAYINDGVAIKGDPNKGLKWDNSIWYFSSDANRLMFKTFPEKFTPQYGGYCASAIASGFTADINPDVWFVENDRLYLFFDDSAKSDFIANINNGIIDRADMEWSKH